LGATVDISDHEGVRPLEVAMLQKKKNCLCVLIGANANINFQANDKNTPLHTAVKEGYDQLVELFIKAGAELNLPDVYGYNPLMTACTIKGYEKIALMLISKGGLQLRYKDPRDNTPLHLACQGASSEVVLALIGTGANVNVLNENFIKPLHFAAMGGSVDICKILLDNHATVNDIDWDGNSALHYAVLGDHLAIVELLLQHKADVNIANNEKQLPLHLAFSASTHTKIIVALIRHGSNLQAMDENGYTPLHLIAQHGEADILKRIALAGANINCRTKDGKTPLGLAMQFQQVEVIRVLKSFGAKL